MSQRQQYITLDSVITDYLNESEQSNNRYFKLFHLAFRGLEELGLDFFYQIKSVKLTVNANKTVTLPADYLNYNKIGILNGIGELIPLKYNDKLSTYNDLRPTRIADNSSSNFVNLYSYSSPIFFNYWNGTSFDNLYGVPGNSLYGGGFKIDASNGVILLDPTFAYTGLVMEYTASPDAGTEYQLPMAFREAMIAWLSWKDIASLPATRKGTLGDKRDRRHEYFEARRRGIDKFRPFYLDQAYINNQDSTRLVVKS